jgi:preprotein translocase subunit YajC
VFHSSFSLQPVGGSSAPGAPSDAHSSGGQPGGMGGLVSFLPILIFIPILFLMFRRQRKEQAQRASLKKGDKVVSNSGLIGELMEIDDKYAKVKIAPGTTVQMMSTSVAPFAEPAPAATASKELKDAKAVSDKK